MSRLLALIVFLAAAGYLAREYARPTQAFQPPAPPPMADPSKDAMSIFSEREIMTIQQSLRDADPEVRWAAAQLLYNVRDPELGALLEKLITEDPDADLRVKIVGLMKGREDSVLLGGLVKGLRDIDKSVRIASLKAIGDIGDPSVSTWVTALLKDPEPEVKVAALQTLGRFQEKRKADFRALADKLRKDYENAQKRAAARQGGF
ncbi:MAG: HEAT repeat domain-containing protein [Elusimicrobiota bacterium]